MKILAINSSFRGAKGFTNFLIDRLFDGAKEKGTDCETINLSEIKINHCIDCKICQEPEHHLKCVFDGKDDVAMVYNKMKEADIIVFATPVYTFAMSSLLKMFLERYYGSSKVGEFSLTKSGLFFHHVDSCVCGKPFVILVVCDNLEDETPKNIVSYFKTYSKFMDSEIAGTLVRKTARMFDFNQGEKNSNPVVSSVYASYVQAGRELATSGRISGPTEKKANEPIIKIPFFVKPMLKLGIAREKVIEAHDKIMHSINKNA